MNWTLRTDDWQVCCLGQVAGGAGAGVGYFTFAFYSERAGGTARYYFTGGGIGAGGNASGVVNPADYGALSSPWTQMSSIPYMQGIRPFNTYDLNGAGGRISSLGVGALGSTYGVTYITASPWNTLTNAYFWSQQLSGLGYGASGLSGVVLLGTWTFASQINLRP